jgi:hypothetical protein
VKSPHRRGLAIAVPITTTRRSGVQRIKATTAAFRDWDNEFIHLVDDIIGRLGPRLDPEQALMIRGHSEAGDWDEAVDLLVATLVKRQNPITLAERADLVRILEDLNEPTSRLDEVNVSSGA